VSTGLYRPFAGEAAPLRVAVVGATGLVGREIVSLLTEREFPVSDLFLYASRESEGEEIEFRNEPVLVERLPEELPPVDLAFLCATAEVSRLVAEDLSANGSTVIDLSSAYRSVESVPLVLAGWQPAEDWAWTAILSIPDALTVSLASPLRALATVSAPKRMIATALVSASAFGHSAVAELSAETIGLLNAREATHAPGTPLAFSCVPQGLSQNAGEGTLGDEVARDLRRLLGRELDVTLTVVRTPTFHAHGVSVTAETVEPVPIERLKKALREAPSLLFDEAGAQVRGTRDVVGSDGIHIGAVRVDSSRPHWVHFWVAADNVRQGAGLTALAVAEAVLRRRRQHS
jgi:aspartate-semialdehyde dehydrogenase